MSRIGLQPIEIPSGVKVSQQGQTISVEGPKGRLSWTHRPEITVEIEDGKTVNVSRADDERQSKSLHGLTRSLIANMVEGCSKGYERGLEVYGAGFSVAVQGKQLNVICGLSHPASFTIPDGIEVEITAAQSRVDTDPAKFTIRGADKQAVGEFAARVRRSRPPEPYKGKGIRYAGEYVRRKAGKAAVGS
ncbi:MAG: 50S ribosomal protein L6 [Phycisphaerae bacterium]